LRFSGCGKEEYSVHRHPRRRSDRIKKNPQLRALVILFHRQEDFPLFAPQIILFNIPVYRKHHLLTYSSTKTIKNSLFRPYSEYYYYICNRTEKDVV
jgi:hypothetical protein